MVELRNFCWLSWNSINWSCCPQNNLEYKGSFLCNPFLTLHSYSLRVQEPAFDLGLTERKKKVSTTLNNKIILPDIMACFCNSYHLAGRGNCAMSSRLFLATLSVLALGRICEKLCKQMNTQKIIESR